VEVPFLDLKAQYRSIRPEVEEAIRKVLQSTAFAGGPFVEAFEEEFARFCGVRYAVGVGSGTEALWFALLACDVGPGDEVITVPTTFIATVEAIHFTGARVVFVDIDEDTYTMDPNALAAAVSPRTKAIIPVHIFGQPADMDPICEVAERYNIPVIEDACQAHGARYKGRVTGSMGTAGCFSFYPGKNLGAYGEAGAVVTDSTDVAERVRRLRDHGQLRKYHHTCLGWNGRMDGLQAAVLSVKLRHLQAWNEARRARASRYAELLSRIPEVVLPLEASYAYHVYHVYAVRIPHRDEVLRRLSERGIHCGIHYPRPLHLEPALERLGLSEGSFPVAEACMQEFLSLPMYPELTEDQITAVCSELVCVLQALAPA